VSRYVVSAVARVLNVHPLQICEESKKAFELFFSLSSSSSSRHRLLHHKSWVLNKSRVLDRGRGSRQLVLIEADGFYSKLYGKVFCCCILYRFWNVM